ncbi:MAG: ABC transporter substrate-binding protein [Alphaproteobacteria bacterium]|nr:ABC transporter substrate-binding protein [Alphaproteobacteria bacterium]
MESEALLLTNNIQERRRWLLALLSGLRLPNAGMAVFVGIAAICLGLLYPGTLTAQKRSMPQRIVSLNLCTDQLVMMLAGPERIAAISHLSIDPALSVLSGQARRLPITYGQAEEVFLLKPDLIVAGSFHLNATVDILRRLGLKVEEFDSTNSFVDIRTNVRRMGVLLGEREKAEALITEMDRRLSKLDAERSQRPALAALYYANSYTSGANTLASEVVERAGFENLGSRAGLTGTAELALETLVMARPDLVVTGLSYEAPALAQEVFAHPALAYLQKRSGAVAVPENLWICGLPQTAEAVEALAAAKRTLPAVTARSDLGKPGYSAHSDRVRAARPQSP